MSSSPSSLHPPYALPTVSSAVNPTGPAPSPAARRLPFVPPVVRTQGDVEASSESGGATRPPRRDAVVTTVGTPASLPLVSGLRLDTPLYVPAICAPEDDVPSIDEFLSESPAMRVVPSASGELSAPVERSAAREPSALDERTDPGESSEPHDRSNDEPWALADATDAIADLAQGLAVTPGASGASGAAPERHVPPLDPWSDDEQWMDIMPTLQDPNGPDLTGETAWARAFAEPPAPFAGSPTPESMLHAGRSSAHPGDVEAAATALEAVARRLRAGELHVPGFRGDRGDAAALAAALSALLGARE